MRVWAKSPRLYTRWEVNIVARSKLSQSWINRLKAVESSDTTFVNETMPIVLKNGRGMFVTDVDGRRYRDFTACFGVLAFGHRPVTTLTAMRKQARHLIHGMGDVHPTESKILFLELLAKISPYANPKIHLSSSGADAVESALKTAMLYTKRCRFVSFSGAYHGLHLGALGIAGLGFFKEGFEEFLTNRNLLLPFPNSENENEVLTVLEDALRKNDIAAVVLEVMQARGGERMFSQYFLQETRKLTKKYGTVLVFDEIYTGFYRTGKRFALEYSGVIPDLLCVGKALGGGFPISACIGEILDCWGETSGEARHTSTFLGYPMACATGYATIKAFLRQESKIISAACAIENEMRRFDSLYQSDALAKKFPLKIYGHGFMHGLHFETMHAGFAAELMEKLLSHGFLVLPSGSDAKTLSLSPPLIATPTDYRLLFSALKKVLRDLVN